MIMEAQVIRYKGYIACKNGIDKSLNPYSTSDALSGDALERETGWNYADEENQDINLQSN